MTFGERLQEIRKTGGLSQEQLAEKCNVTRQSVSKWELGQDYPETEKLLALCRILNVSLDDLMQDEMAGSSAPKPVAADSPYRGFLGKWGPFFFTTKNFPAYLSLQSLQSTVNMSCSKAKQKKGLFKLADIRSISEAKLSKKQELKLPHITLFELPPDTIQEGTFFSPVFRRLQFRSDQNDSGRNHYDHTEHGGDCNKNFRYPHDNGRIK